MKKIKKPVFVIQVDNVIDLITNSSSELFVLSSQTKEIVTELIESTYSDFRSEYEEPINIKDLDIERLNQYFDYFTYPGIYPAKKKDYPIIPGFTFEELYEPKKHWETGEIEPPAWNGEIQYELKNNDQNSRWGRYVTEENREELIKKLNPTGDLWFLYSLDENPDWEKQEDLSSIASRYHLG
jgi:hypothetical protein